MERVNVNNVNTRSIIIGISLMEKQTEKIMAIAK